MSTVTNPPPGYINVSLQDIQQIGIEKFQFKSQIEKQEFLDLVQSHVSDDGNPVLTIPKPINAQQLGLTTSSLGNWGNEANITDLMSLLHTLGLELRKSSKHARAAAQSAEISELNAAADKIKSAAGFALAAGIVGGAMQIGGGLVSGLGTIKASTTSRGQVGFGDKAVDVSQAKTDLGQASGFKGKIEALQNKLALSKPALEASKAAPNKTPDHLMNNLDKAQANYNQALKGSDTNAIDKAKVDLDAAKFDVQDWNMKTLGVRGRYADAQTQQWNAAGQILQGSGQVVSAGLEYAAKGEEHQKAKMEAEASKFRYLAQEENEVVDKMKELVAEVRGKLQEMQQADHQIHSRIWS